MSRWELYGKCKKVVNYYVLTGIIPIIGSVFLGCTVTWDRIAKLLILIVAITIMISWNYAEEYYKYLHDIFFKKVEKKVFYVLSVYHSKRIFDTEDWLIEKIRFYRIKRVKIRCYNEYKQSIIEHNLRMDEIKAPKRTRKGIPGGVCEFECFCVPMCNELKNEDRIEISYLKGTNTVVDLKPLPKTELNVELCLEKKIRIQVR